MSLKCGQNLSWMARVRCTPGSIERAGRGSFRARGSRQQLRCATCRHPCRHAHKRNHKHRMLWGLPSPVAACTRTEPYWEQSGLRHQAKARATPALGAVPLPLDTSATSPMRFFPCCYRHREAVEAAGGGGGGGPKMPEALLLEWAVHRAIEVRGQGRRSSRAIRLPTWRP
jgi:hypothetical protein